MLVDLMDGRCRTCGSQLVIVDADDATLTVACIECDDNYQLEPDALRDGYYPRYRAKQMAEGGRA